MKGKETLTTSNKLFTFVVNLLIMALWKNIIILMTFASCQSADSTQKIENTTITTIDSTLFNKISGSFSIEVKGDKSDSKEYLDLKKNGEAIWTWSPYNQVKTGKWFPKSKDNIIVQINGKTGILEEEFTKVNGVFISNISSDRYLKSVKSKK